MIFDMEEIESLKLKITACDHTANYQKIIDGSVHRTSTINIYGDGKTGYGEDVTFLPQYHDDLEGVCRRVVANDHLTLGEFVKSIRELEIFGVKPNDHESVCCRRWAFESAALNLALKQNSKSIGDFTNIQWVNPSYVVSLRVQSPKEIDRIKSILDILPSQKFKVDATSSWSDQMVYELASLNCISIVDLKGHYLNTPLEQSADMNLYHQVFEGLSDSYVEDPLICSETESLINFHRNRVTWDAPIFSSFDLDRMPVPGVGVNIKPSRCGGLRELIDLYDYCRKSARFTYFGGQYEVSIGREQNQYLAGLLCPNNFNDIAPTYFNDQYLKTSKLTKADDNGINKDKYNFTY